MNNLKPCPFCGSNNLEDHYVFIKCTDCGEEGPPSNNKRNDAHADFVDNENAIEYWNERKKRK